MTRSALHGTIVLSVTLGCASSHLLAPGMRAPDFRARDQSGRERTLVENRGHTVVLFFYPRDGTPGCTREACSLRDIWNRFEAVDARVLGVSTDDVASHATFAREHHLTFPLLADPDGVIVRLRCGSYVRNGFAHHVPHRPRRCDSTGISRCRSRCACDATPRGHCPAPAVVSGLHEVRLVRHRSVVGDPSCWVLFATEGGRERPTCGSVRDREWQGTLDVWFCSRQRVAANV
jgi:peroxiredoxin